MDPWLESARPSTAQPHWPSPVGRWAAWWRAGWMAPQTHRWCSQSSPGSSPFASQWWCGTPAFLWLPEDKIYQHLWTLHSSENLILNHQQTFSTTCLGTPGKSMVFWAVHVREGSLSQLKSDWLDMARVDPVSTSDCPWGHNQFTSRMFMEDLSSTGAVRD